MKYNPFTKKSHKKLNHKRNIIWFKPSFSKNISTNVVKYFSKLHDKQFPPNHCFHIFNKSSIKVSYSRRKKTKTIINKHDKNIPETKPSITTSPCNYRKKKVCSWNWQCKIVKVVYKSTLTSNKPNYKEKKYFGNAEESFKGRLFKHSLSFRNKIFKKVQNFLRNSGKSRWRFAPRK